MTVAFQGEHGAFSELAALHFFKKNIHTLPLKSFDDVFNAVEHRTAPCGIVPIENSIYGSVHQNYDLLQKHNLSIAGEIKVRIVHALLVHHGVALRDIRFIYSHPQALGQCERFLNKMKKVEIVAVYDTAGAAKLVRTERKQDAAAIASLEAAKLYGLRVLKKNIETDSKNFTRFLILSKKPSHASSNAKTSVIFSTKDIPGALFKVLAVFALRDINLHKIESRPIVGKPWEYLFYVDFDGSIHNERCRQALEHLQELTSYLKILGSYRQGNTVGKRKR